MFFCLGFFIDAPLKLVSENVASLISEYLINSTVIASEGSFEPLRFIKLAMMHSFALMYIQSNYKRYRTYS